MSTNTFATVLNQEAVHIQSQILELEGELKVIEKLRQRRAGFTVHDGGQAGSIQAAGKGGTKKKTVKTKKTTKKSAMSSMDMARQVLDNNGGRKGSEMSHSEIRNSIQATFGVEAASSLDQMLYKRGKARKGFYRTPEGKYGRIEWLRPAEAGKKTALAA